MLKKGIFSPGFCYIENTSSEANKCRGVYESKEEKRALMTENVVVSASTCRLKRPGYLVLSPLEADERQLTQEQVIFEKSIGDESGHSPSTLLPSCSVLNKSSQSSCGASFHGLSSGNVSLQKERYMKELKMELLRSWSSCSPNSEEFPSAEGDGRVVSLMGKSSVVNKMTYFNDEKRFLQRRRYFNKRGRKPFEEKSSEV